MSVVMRCDSDCVEEDVDTDTSDYHFRELFFFKINLRKIIYLSGFCPFEDRVKIFDTVLRSVHLDIKSFDNDDLKVQFLATLKKYGADNPLTFAYLRSKIF